MDEFHYWNQLHDHLKKDVVKNLDFLDRVSLRGASKASKESVDKCPLPLRFLRIFQNRDSQNDKKIHLTLMTMDNKSYKRTVENGEELAEFFMRTFKYPESSCECLAVNILSKTGDVCLDKLHDELVNSKISLKVKALMWQVRAKEAEFVHGFAQRLVPLHLNRLILVHKTPGEIIEKLIETEQWRGLKLIQLGEGEKCKFEMNLQIGSLFNAIQWKIHVPEVSDDDILQVIENFRITPRNIGAFFSIKQRKHAENRNLFLLKLGVRFENLPNNDLRDKTFVQTYRIDRGQKELVVKFSEFMTEIEGVICEINESEDQFIPVFPEERPEYLMRRRFIIRDD